tara:strand:- start:3481 stop:4341 length:861 start_codon:yes stop_codon:yes gene_type:complete
MRSISISTVGYEELLSVLQYSDEYRGVLGYFRLLCSVALFKYEIKFVSNKNIIDSISSRNDYAKSFRLHFNEEYEDVIKVRRVSLSFPLCFSRKGLLLRLVKSIKVYFSDIDEVILFNQYGLYEYVVRKVAPDKVSFVVHSYLDVPFSDWQREDMLNYCLSGKYKSIYIPEDFEGSDFYNTFVEVNENVTSDISYFSSREWSYPDDYVSYPLRYMGYLDIFKYLPKLLILQKLKGVVVIPHPKNKKLVMLFRLFSTGDRRKGVSSKIILDDLTSDSVAKQVESQRY